jgi:hypothetical protein
MDIRDMRGYDGRRLPPRNARGEFRRRRRSDRGMDYARGDMNYTGGRGGYPMRGGDYAQNQMDNMDMRGDYRGNDMGGMARRGDYGYDGHYGMHGGRQGGYEPVEFMGYCNGYYGMPHQDYARGGRYDYGYDYGYGDYGETLSDEELEHFNKKLLSQLSDQEKQMLSKEAVMQRAKALNRPMENFGEKELYTATLMWYTDNKEFFGQNVDFAVKGGYAFLADKDVKVKGAEKLAVYYDCIVEGEDD